MYEIITIYSLLMLICWSIIRRWWFSYLKAYAVLIDTPFGVFDCFGQPTKENGAQSTGTAGVCACCNSTLFRSEDNFESNHCYATFSMAAVRFKQYEDSWLYHPEDTGLHCKICCVGNVREDGPLPLGRLVCIFSSRTPHLPSPPILPDFPALRAAHKQA